MWVSWEGSEECGCAGRGVRSVCVGRGVRSVGVLNGESGEGVRSVGDLGGECRHSFCRCKCLLICKACRH